MRIEILNSNGDVLNAIAATTEFAEANYPGSWKLAAVQDEFVPSQPVVPQQVTKAQGKAALILAGLWEPVLDHVAQIPDPVEKALAEVALHDATTWERSSPFLNAAAAGLGLTVAQLDELFIQAGGIAL